MLPVHSVMLYKYSTEGNLGTKFIYIENTKNKFHLHYS